jgi:hypothetical protein
VETRYTLPEWSQRHGWQATLKTAVAAGGIGICGAPYVETAMSLAECDWSLRALLAMTESFTLGCATKGFGADR